MKQLMLVLAALLPLAFATANTTANLTSFEIIYPRNETYKTEGNMPIVLAVYNMGPTDTLGNYSLNWDITGYSFDDMPGGLAFAQGQFYPRNVTAPEDGKPLILADFVDLEDKIVHSSFDFRSRLVLQVFLLYDNGHSNIVQCVKQETADFPMNYGPQVGFRLELGYHGNYRNKEAVPIDVGTATGCPAAGAGMSVPTYTGTGTTASSCQFTQTPKQTTDCPFTVDAAMASSISSSVSVLMIPPPTTTVSTYTRSNPAAQVPVQTGLAMAGGILGAAMLL